MPTITMPEPRWYAAMHGQALYGVFDTPEAAFEAVSDTPGLMTIDRLITTTQAEAYADARVRGVQQWQPIETAPKDGRTLLLGYFNSHGNWRTVRGQWMSEDYIAEHWEDPDDVEPGWFETSVEADDIPNCWRIEPSHWMLLPAPPISVPEICQPPDKCEWGPRKDGDPIGAECVKCGLVIPF